MIKLSRLGQITERYAGLMSTIGDAILFISPDNVIQECSDRIFEITGYTRGELEGKDLDILLQDEDAGHKRYFDDYMLGNHSFENTHRDVKIKRKDGTVIPVRISRSTYNNGDDQVFVAIIYPT